MITPPPPAILAYRAAYALVGVLALGFGIVSEEVPVRGLDPAWVRRAVAVVAFGAIGATYLSGWARRHVRALTYGLFLLVIGALAVLCAASGYAAPYAAASVFAVLALGLGGGITSRSLAPVAACVGAAVVLPVVGLLFAESPGVEPVGYAALLVASGAAVLALVWRHMAGRAALTAEHERYRAVVERTSDGVLIADAETREVLDANPVYLAMTGYTLDEIRALRLSDLAPAPDGARLLAEAVGEAGEGETVHIGPRRHRPKDGEPLDVEVSASRLGHGDRAALCLFVRDASRQREAEHRLREAADAADAAREQAETLLRLKSSLLQDLSHEIRTPLTGILGYADLLAETVEGEGREMALVIERGARRLMHTVNSVLDLARLESGEGGVEVGPVDLVAEAEAVRDALAPLADAKGVALRLDRPPAPVWVQAEAGALVRLLNNLVGNALKFTEEGTVRVVVRAGGGRPALVVRDTGIGIPASFLPHLFDEFRRARSASSHRHEGTGLGLAISRRLVEMMGGAITVESTEGLGTEFTVRFQPAETPPRSRVGPAVAMAG